MKLILLLILFIVGESSAQMTTSSSCRIDGTKLIISTSFDNKLKIDSYILTNNWFLDCRSYGDILYSDINPKSNFISIIPQFWSKENGKIFFDDQHGLRAAGLTCFPDYFLIPKGSTRRLTYTISFVSENRMKIYLANKKLMISYVYQSVDQMKSIVKILGNGVFKNIFKKKELILESIIQIDPIEHPLPPNIASDTDYMKLLSICRNTKKPTDEQRHQFYKTYKYVTDLEYVNFSMK